MHPSLFHNPLGSLCYSISVVCVLYTYMFLWGTGSYSHTETRREHWVSSIALRHILLRHSGSVTPELAFFFLTIPVSKPHPSHWGYRCVRLHPNFTRVWGSQLRFSYMGRKHSYPPSRLPGPRMVFH